MEHPGDSVWRELWISLASLLRSYTALHGLSTNRQPVVESDENRILVRQGERWLELERQEATIRWKRESGIQGRLELTDSGRLRNSSGEEEMDMAAEAWARELTRELMQ